MSGGAVPVAVFEGGHSAPLICRSALRRRPACDLSLSSSARTPRGDFAAVVPQDRSHPAQFSDGDQHPGQDGGVSGRHLAAGHSRLELGHVTGDDAFVCSAIALGNTNSAWRMTR